MSDKVYFGRGFLETELVPLFFRLVKANMKPGDVAFIFTTPGQNPALWNGLAGAIQAVGGLPIVLMVPADYWHKKEPPKAIAEAMKLANICFYSGEPNDISWVYGNARMEAARRGVISVSNMFCIDAMLVAGKADPYEVQKYSKAIEKLYNEGKRYRLITGDGAELVGSLEGRKSYVLCPIAEPPYYAATFAGGETMMAPIEGTSEGTFICDGAIGAGIGVVSEPVKITIREGKIVDAEGGIEASLLKTLIFNTYGYDEGAKNLCELSVGTNPKARTGKGVTVHEWKNLLGTMHIAFGDNTSFGGGHPDAAGKSKSDLHVDCLTLKPTFYIDDQKIVEKGKLLV